MLLGKIFIFCGAENPDVLRSIWAADDQARQPSPDTALRIGSGNSAPQQNIFFQALLMI